MIIKKFQITCLQTKDFVLFHLANSGSLKKKKKPNKWDKDSTVSIYLLLERENSYCAEEWK